MATPSAPPQEDVNGTDEAKKDWTETKRGEQEEEEPRNDFFECNICLDVAKEPIVR